MPPIEMSDRLIVALDVPTAQEATALVDRLEGVVSIFKIGHWLTYARNVDVLIQALLRQHRRVFIDAKMNDIPRTVVEGIKRIAETGAHFVTVDGRSEAVMMEANRWKGKTLKVLSVPMLTTSDASQNAMWHYAKRARECGCDGMIASGLDNPNNLKTAACSPDFIVATPGVRLAEDDNADGHIRATTPRQAISHGADYIIVGRPIVTSQKPLLAAVRFILDMERGHADSAEG